MLKEELEAMIGHSVTVEQYDLVNHVYMYHPASILKEHISVLWKMGGLKIFEDLTPIADKMKELKKQELFIKTQLREIEQKIDTEKERYKDNAQD